MTVKPVLREKLMLALAVARWDNGYVARNLMKQKRIPPQQGTALKNRSSRPVPVVPDRGSITAEAAAVEIELDDALAATFPASDPVAVDPPSPKQGKGGRTRVQDRHVRRPPE